MKSKKIFYGIFVIFLTFVLILLINFNSFKKKLSPFIPDTIKQKIKQNIIGEYNLKIIDDFNKTNKISNYYNQKILPETQFLKINIQKLSLKKFDLKSSPAKNNKMFVKPETTTFYLDQIDEKLIVLSSLGKFIFLDLKSLFDDDLDEAIDPIINFDQTFSKVLDVFVFEQKIFLSFAKKIKEDCYKIGVMQSKFSQIEMSFNTIFLNDECTASAYAGKMINYIFNNKSGILLSIDALSKKKDQAQNIKSNLGKILFLNLDNYSFTQFSKGHRNPQGLYNDNGVIISTEHGPRGGDEINIIKENKNYGWPISSYGEPYNFEKSDKTKYNYLKNHKKNGFEEPVFSFVPSIGISQLIKIPEGFNEFWKNNYLITSLNSGSIYRTKISLLDNKLNFIEKIFIGERIRDIIYIKNLKIILLALENTGSIGVLSNFIEN